MYEKFLAYGRSMPEDFLVVAVAIIGALVIKFSPRIIRFGLGKYYTRKHLESLFEKGVSDEEFLAELSYLGIYIGSWLKLEGKMGWGLASQKLMAQIISRLIKLHPWNMEFIAQSMVEYFICRLKTKWLRRQEVKFVENHVDDLLTDILSYHDRYKNRGLRKLFELHVDGALNKFIESLEAERLKDVTDAEKRRHKLQKTWAYRTLVKAPKEKLIPVLAGAYKKVGRILLPAPADTLP